MNAFEGEDANRWLTAAWTCARWFWTGAERLGDTPAMAESPALRVGLIGTAPRTDTAPTPRRGLPVFISDCATPCAGTTLLQVLWERDLKRLMDDDQP